MPNTPPFFHHKHRGSALLLLLIIVVVGAAFLLNALKSNPHIERDKVTADALAKAKEALIGYAATYRDSHAGKVFGYLPCPDINNDGVADTPCGTTDSPVIGRLPWRTLGLPPPRDSSGECLWYAVSGTFKNNPPTGILNWDTIGQFVIQDETGAIITGATAETRPAAVIFSPRTALAGQDRTPAGTSECGGNNTPGAYLEGNNAFASPPIATTDTTITLTSGTSGSATNNDRLLWIAPAEIFRLIKQRSNFKTPTPTGDVNNLLSSSAACLNALATLPPPVAIDFATMSSSAGTTVGNLVTGRIAPNYLDTTCTSITTWIMAWGNWWNATPTYTGKNFYDNWQDNLLYAKCTSGQCLTVNGAPCSAVLIFAGERAAGISRATAASKNVISNYLEGDVLTAFTTGGTTFAGATSFSITDVNIPAPADVLACINAAGGVWPFEYPTQWAGVPALDPATVAVGGGTDTTGSSGNDDVNITGNLATWVDLKSGNDELLVTGNFTGGGSFGAGDDTVKIGGDLTGAIDMGSGDDYVDVGGDSSGYIDVGSGSDKVRIGGDALASITFGSGDDELQILGSASGSIDAGEGNDKIRIEENMTAYTNLGGGDDLLIIFGNAAGVAAGPGNDVILIGGDATNWLDLGSGNDYLEILGNSAGLDAGGDDDIIKITGNATNSINLNSGGDHLQVGGTITWIDGGSGTDRIHLPHYTMADCATLLTSKISTNVEHVKLSDGVCKGDDFTFP